MKTVCINITSPGSSGALMISVSEAKFAFLEELANKWNHSKMNQHCAAPYIEIISDKEQL